MLERGDVTGLYIVNYITVVSSLLLYISRIDNVHIRIHMLIVYVRSRAYPYHLPQRLSLYLYADAYTERLLKGNRSITEESNIFDQFMRNNYLTIANTSIRHFETD